MISADILADLIYRGFRAYRQDFCDLTEAAKTRFSHGQWLDAQNASSERLALYHQHTSLVLTEMETFGVTSQISPALWAAAKGAYQTVSQVAQDFELAETFYNSIFRAATDDADADNRLMFVEPAYTPPTADTFPPVFTRHQGRRDIAALVRDILNALDLEVQWRDLELDVKNILRSLAEAHREIRRADSLEIQVIDEVFYRNKGAYVVGRLIYQGDEGTQMWPLALPILLDHEEKAFVDTLICDTDELSVVFSFTRAYFMVNAPHPYALVDYLQQLLPEKKHSELYASLGFHKHSKTEFYRGFLDHLNHSADPFIVAPGVKGMVMTVFTLPSYQTVFKVIRDRFAAQKTVSRDQVKAAYSLVKRHDRVGRMADTQEFSNITFPRARFADELIDELQRMASESITLTDDTVVIHHLYTERLMTPLNIFIETADDHALKNALDEYGNAIKQLAAANIFPGDMLLKNFGITRHNRVVFYDYDEICYLTDVHFRKIPQARTPEDEMSAEVWYSVGPKDVFPEEFQRFLFGRPRIKQLFRQMHGELFDADYWKGLQDAIEQGQVVDVFPYRRKRRFQRRG